MAQHGDLESVKSLDSSSEMGIPECGDNSGSIDGDDADTEHLDPRVQSELEKLNDATDAINKLEKQLDEAKLAGRHAFQTMTHKLQEFADKLGKCIQKARPYYEARVELRKVQAELQHAALHYEKANAQLKASKEMVKLTEEGLTRQGGRLDETWQEMLNYATKKVAQCEMDLRQRQREHWHSSKEYSEAESKVKGLEKKFKSSINKSKPYYELRAQMNHFVEKEKFRVYQLEQTISKAKITYADGLASLEGISEQIHLQRQLRDELLLRQRDSGCGTMSDSHSYTDSLDLASISDVQLDIDRPDTAASDRHQAVLETLHDIVDARPKSQNSDRESLKTLPARKIPVRSHTPVPDHSSKNAQSFPLLTSLENELSRLQSDCDKKVLAARRKKLETAESVDSAVDSGSECEPLDDDLIDDLHLEQAV